MPFKHCFVIAPIGETGSEVRKRSDQVFHHVVQPVFKELGYQSERADQIAEPGLITSQVIQRVLTADMVVADLTGRNPNVFYELAVRHASRKPLVQVIKKGEQIPFDVAGMRTIQLDLQDLDSVESVKADIRSQVAVIEAGDGTIENPITVSIDLKGLRESGNPEKRSLADILEAVAEVKNTVSRFEAHLNSIAPQPNPKVLSWQAYDDLLREVRKYVEYGVPQNQALRTVIRHHGDLPGEVVERLMVEGGKPDHPEPRKPKTKP